jgi:hypothetical protein
LQASSPATKSYSDEADADEGEEDTSEELTVRYVRVVNKTGKELKVYVRLDPSDEPWSWRFAAGKTGYLKVDGKKLAAGAIYLWAEAGSTRWGRHRTKALNLVPKPYRADDAETYTHTFED